MIFVGIWTKLSTLEFSSAFHSKEKGLNGSHNEKDVFTTSFGVLRRTFGDFDTTFDLDLTSKPRTLSISSSFRLIPPQFMPLESVDVGRWRICDRSLRDLKASGMTVVKFASCGSEAEELSPAERSEGYEDLEDTVGDLCEEGERISMRGVADDMLFGKLGGAGA
jgi:hypothetical protein